MRKREPLNPPRIGARHDLRTIRTLLPYLWPAGQAGLRLRVVAALLLLVAAKVTNVTVPIFYKQAVDALSGDPTNVGVTSVVVVPVALLVGYGLVRVLAQAFGELRDAVFAKVAQRAIRLAGLRTFEHLHRLSLRFHLDRKTGGVSRAIERGARGIEFLLNFTIFNVLPTILEIFLVCGILWNLYGPWFAAATFVTIGCYITWTLTLTEWRNKFRRIMNDTDSEAHTKAIDSLLNFETVKYFGNEAHEARRFDGALAAYERAAVNSRVSLTLLNIGQGAIIAAGLTTVMIMAGNRVAAGAMTLGDFVLVNSYLIQLYLPLNFLGFVYREIKRSLIDMEQMFALVEEKAEVKDPPGAQALKPNGGWITFEGVTFSYDPRRPVLKDVSFQVPPGGTVAIVGSSGAGKSTISRILFRFYDVDSGRVLIDGQDIRAVTQDSLRAAIGMVPQDTVLFNDTVYYNIAYGRPEATPGEVEEAARLARIHDFVIKQPDGYQTMVGERGLKLSGGEKQRVAIARTILKQPRILLFDEATSALDTHTEREIQESLREVSAERTTLVIAHRLSTVIDADEILVLEAGRVVEQGSHLDLLVKNGRYADMWTRQQEAAEAREVLEQVGTGNGSPETEADPATHD
jgi:ATP-binding cassette, subfamily B, heavy metal transporter